MANILPFKDATPHVGDYTISPSNDGYTVGSITPDRGWQPVAFVRTWNAAIFAASIHTGRDARVFVSRDGEPFATRTPERLIMERWVSVFRSLAPSR